MQRTKRALLMILALALMVSAMPAQVFAAPKAQKVEITQASVKLDLAGTKMMQLTAKVLPAGASQKVTWATGNKSIAMVSSKGIITAKKRGSTTVGAKPAGGTKWTKIKVTVADTARPSSLAAPGEITLAVGERFEIVPTYLPEGSATDTAYASKSAKVATVSTKGVVLGKKVGKTQVTVRSKRNTSLSKVVTVSVSNPKAPQSIQITPDDKTMTVGQKLQLKAAVKPETASSGITWKTSNKNVATVTVDGLVTALKIGNVQIAAVSKYNADVKMIRSITVADPNAPSAIAFLESYGSNLYFVKSDTATLEYSVSPSGARDDAVFTSSNSKIVAVDEVTGRITCKDTGVATITVTAKGTKLADSIKVTVSSASKVTTLPARTTADDKDDVKENLAKIDAIKNSAFSELTNLKNSGAISASEQQARKEAINNAFVNYGIAWETDDKITYWNSALSATNDFKSGKLYYGMPYIQHGSSMNYANRQFNLAKAVAQGYMKLKSGSTRVYDLTNKRLNKYYVGCDCSSFVSMSIWGTGHSASYLNTVMIQSSNFYRTITGKNTMRPGDILNRSGSHVIMFLYYTDAAKTQMMLIEQGGNTVSCNVTNVSKYASYTVKRPLKYS